jgi:uncharacterized membrane protein YfcA
MGSGTALFVAGVFVIAGLVKGIIGLGLPTISMGLLALVMPPVEAAAILILPSLLTNVWQAFAGHALGKVARRLWPMMVAVCAGTWLGAGLMTGPLAHYGTAVLGVALIIYAIIGLAAFRITVAPRQEPVAGPLCGLATGVITAATGVFVIPAVPYLQAIGLERDDLVQALGFSFTVSTLALAVNVGTAGALNVANGGLTVIGLAFACAGMWAGQHLRARLSPEKFRRWFFVGLLLLGLYLLAESFA